MLISKIVAGVNNALAGEMLTYLELEMHLDRVIDDINTELGATYPAFSDLESGTDTYDAFPDTYIRTVVIPGAAHYFYMVDEEGLDSAPAIERLYSRGIFYMKRDWFNNVPLEYQRSTESGILFEDDTVNGERGITIDPGIYNA